MDEQVTRLTGQEKFYSCNTLVCLLQALKGRKTTIEFRNEAEVYGTIESVDGYMNVTVRGARFTDAAGSSAPFDSFFVHGRQIRYVHIPDEVSPLSAIRRQLEVNSRGGRVGRADEAEKVKRSGRTKKAQAYTRDTVRAMNAAAAPRPLLAAAGASSQAAGASSQAAGASSQAAGAPSYATGVWAQRRGLLPPPPRPPPPQSQQVHRQDDDDADFV